MPNDIAEPKTFKILLLSIVIFVGGFSPEAGFPQHKIPYERGDVFPPPGNSTSVIMLSTIEIFFAPGWTTIPAPVKLFPLIVRPEIVTFSVLLVIVIPEV